MKRAAGHRLDGKSSKENMGFAKRWNMIEFRYFVTIIWQSGGVVVWEFPDALLVILADYEIRLNCISTTRGSTRMQGMAAYAQDISTYSLEII